MERVVVTGVGGITNIGHDAPSIWHSMSEGRSGISEIDLPDFNQWSDDEWHVKIAGQIRDWDSTTRLDKREVRRLDRFAVLGVSAAYEAAESSGIDFSKENDTRCGVVIGSGVGGIQTIEQSVQTLHEKGPTRLSPFTVPRLMANAIAGDVAIRFGLRGPSSSHTTACASSGHSIGDAMHIIMRGEADIMLAGGSEAAVSPLCIGSFASMKALSTRNDAPQQASRPFDVDRDGFVLSEGAAVLVLESESHAKARGAEILCELLACCTTTDAGHITAPDPEGAGAARAMSGALKNAGLNPEDVDYINAHGTSTPLGDRAELSAVKNVFGDHALQSKGGPPRDVLDEIHDRALPRCIGWCGIDRVHQRHSDGDRAADHQSGQS